VLPLPTGNIILAATGTAISVLDLVAAKPLRLITNHQKTVTSLTLASHGRRVLSGGLDGHVKVFDTATWNVVAGLKFPSPVLSLSVITAGSNHDDRHLAVGQQSGVLNVRTRLAGVAADRAREKAAEQAALDAGSEALGKFDARRAKQARGVQHEKEMERLAQEVDAVIDTRPTKRRMKELGWHEDLRRGRYAAALDAVVSSKAAYESTTVLSLLMTLRRRSALREALEGRDEAGVLPLVRWAAKHLMDPQYLSICTDVALHLMDLYGEFVEESPALAAAFRDMLSKVRTEVDTAQMAIVTNGMVESLMMGALA
jgi:U3 small nucleolar RNA-associated protein 15